MSTRCWMNVCFDGFLVWGLGCSCLRGFVFVVWLSSYSWWAVAWRLCGWFIRLLGWLWFAMLSCIVVSGWCYDYGG